MSITLRDIAQRAGVSISTTSRALNDKADVSEDVRLRVRTAAQDLNYIANPHARALVAGGSHTLGLIIASSGAPFLNMVVSGILDSVTAHGYSIMVFNTGENPQHELQAYQRLREERVLGILVTSVQSGSAPLLQLAKEGTPFVLVNRRLDDLDSDYTIGDLRQGMHDLVNHLWQLGHRRIAYLGGRADHFPSRERAVGYRLALQEFGIPYDPALERFSDGRLETFYALTKELMSAPTNPPTAIFTYNDWNAAAVLRALHALGYRVPQDVSVVGYDDLEFAGFLEPPLTTMTQQAYEIGQAGVKILIERLNWPAEQPWPIRHVVFKPQLMVRGSTGPAPMKGA